MNDYTLDKHIALKLLPIVASEVARSSDFSSQRLPQILRNKLIWLKERVVAAMGSNTDTISSRNQIAFEFAAEIMRLQYDAPDGIIEESISKAWILADALLSEEDVRISIEGVSAADILAQRH
jgi:hypothetical protein